MKAHTVMTKTWWNWGPRERMKRGERKQKSLKNWRDSWCREWQGDFQYLRRWLVFWGTGAKCRTAHAGCSSHSECNPALLRYQWQEKKRHNPEITLTTFTEEKHLEGSKGLDTKEGGISVKKMLHPLKNAVTMAWIKVVCQHYRWQVDQEKSH